MNDKDELRIAAWTTLWIFVFCALAMFALAFDAKHRSSSCEGEVGCGTHIIEQFPEGHGR